MTNLMTDVLLKLARAQMHLDAVRQSVEHTTGEGLPAPIRGKFDPGSGQHVFDTTQPGPPPIGLPVEIGDCVYNLRSALDYVVCGLVRTTGQLETDSTEFPIFVERAMRAPERTKRIGGVPPGADAVIDSFQPYGRWPTDDERENDPLALLYSLANRDKHRRLNVSPVGGSYTFVREDGTPIDPTITGPQVAGFVAAGELPAQAQITLRGPDPDTEVYLKVAYDVAFQEDRPLFMKPVVQTLERIFGHLDTSVIPAFARFFEHS